MGNMDKYELAWYIHSYSYMTMETYLHNIFSEYKITNEWFDIDVDIVVEKAKKYDEAMAKVIMQRG